MTTPAARDPGGRRRPDGGPARGDPGDVESAEPRLGRGGPPCPPRDLAYYVEGVAEGRRGTLVQRQKDRSVWWVVNPERVWFAKRGETPKRRREIRREAQNARLLHRLEFGPEVLAAGTHAHAEWLVTEDARYRGHSLDNALDRLPEFCAALRRFHDGGLAFPDLTTDHVIVTLTGMMLIDSARLEKRSGPVSRSVRARDIAALMFSSRAWDWFPDRIVWVRLARLATGLRGDALRGLFRAIESEVIRLAERTRWRHAACQTDHQFFVDATQTLPAKDWTRETLFDAALCAGSGHIVRTLPDRENRTLGRLPDGRPRFFLKVFPPTKSGWSPAMRELAAIDLFQRAGILVNRVAAYAEDVDKGSMVAVKACAGEPLDDLLRRGVTVAERRALAVQTARIWRRMRECGLRHRDAYPCHVFAKLNPNGAELRLIDMTRAGRAPFPKERWFIKDAAALWHGLPKPPVTRTDAVRWLREYFRIDRLDARAKRFARRVAAKEARIAARQARKRRA